MASGVEGYARGGLVGGAGLFSDKMLPRAAIANESISLLSVVQVKPSPIKAVKETEPDSPNRSLDVWYMTPSPSDSCSPNPVWEWVCSKGCKCGWPWLDAEAVKNRWEWSC